MQLNSGSSSVTQKHAFRELMKGVCTSIPAHIVTFNPELQRAQVQVGLELVLLNGGTERPRVIEDVPVHFAGGDYTLEFEIKNGTEGFLVFSQRCIDGWKNSGGVAANPLTRFFDRQDCYFVPGVRSQPGRITDFQNNGIRLRNKSGDTHVWAKNDKTIIAKNPACSAELKPDGQIEMKNASGFIRLLPNGNVNINGVVFPVSGVVTMPGGLSVAGSMQNNGKNVGATHVHSGVETGPSNTGVPV